MKKLYTTFYLLLFFIAASLYSQPSVSTAVAKVGQNASFNVVVKGTEPFRYQWKKDGVVVTGATRNSYVLNKLNTNMAGNYSVVVSNSLGNVSSDTATLKVLAAPVFSIQPFGVTIPMRSTLTLNSLAVGNPSPTYQWFKDNVAITGATSSTYSVSNTTPANSGIYYVVATSTLDGVKNSTNSNNAAVIIVPVGGKATGNNKK